MTQATVVFANDRFGRSAAGLVYGGLYVQIDQSEFPSRHWTDFVVVVLAWWCRALLRSLIGDRELAEVRFMEGPYVVQIGPRNARSIRLKLVEAGLTRRIRHEAEVSVDILINSVLDAAAGVVSECKARDWWSDDADELADAMKELQKEKMRALN